MNELINKLEKTVEATIKHFSGIRTGRANPEILNRIHVEYYGSMVPIIQVASISVPEPMMLMLNVFDRNAVKNVEKAITTSDLNINPQTEGNIIRLRLPELSEERRIELVKIVKKQAEEGKIALRNIRRDFLEHLKLKEKNKEISQDKYQKTHDEAQKEIDKYSHKIDELALYKEADIMKV